MRRNSWPTTTNPLVYHAVHPGWTADERLWYRDAGAERGKFVLFDPAKLTKEPVLWSPDSKKIATFKQDQRSVGEMYLA